MGTVRDIVFILGAMTLSFFIFSLLMIFCSFLENALEKRPNIFLAALFHVLALLSYIFMLGSAVLWFVIIWFSKETAKDEVAKARESWDKLREIDNKLYKSCKDDLSIANDRIQQLEEQIWDEKFARNEEARISGYRSGYQSGYRNGVYFCKEYFQIEPEDLKDYISCYQYDLKWTLNKDLEQEKLNQ